MFLPEHSLNVGVFLGNQKKISKNLLANSDCFFNYPLGIRRRRGQCMIQRPQGTQHMVEIFLGNRNDATSNNSLLGAMHTTGLNGGEMWVLLNTICHALGNETDCKRRS